MANIVLLKFVTFDAYRQATELHAANLSARILVARKIQLLANVMNIIISGIPQP